MWTGFPTVNPIWAPPSPASALTKRPTAWVLSVLEPEKCPPLDDQLAPLLDPDMILIRQGLHCPGVLKGGSLMALRWPRVLAFAFLFGRGHPPCWAAILNLSLSPQAPLPDYESQWEEAGPDLPESKGFALYLSSSIYPEGTMDFPAIWYNKTWRMQSYGTMYELQKWWMVVGVLPPTFLVVGTIFEFLGLLVLPHWFRPHTYNVSLHIPNTTPGCYRFVMLDSDTQVTVPFWVIPPFRYE